MTDIPYIFDILSQPQSLNSAIELFDPSPLNPLAQAIQRGEFDRIVLTGMGASLYASYPAWMTLVRSGIATLWVNTAELIHHAPKLVTSKSLLWLFSQSGRSAEIIAALDFNRIPRPAALLATVNDLESTLAKAAEYRIPISAEVEKTVSTRTYINTIGVSQLAALSLLGEEVESAREAMRLTKIVMEEYLSTWEKRVKMIGEKIGFPKRLAILGRGASLAATYTGALILGEAAKFLATPFQAGEFRHGPLEMCNPDLTVLLFEGTAETRDLNLRLLEDLRNYHTNAFWIGADKNEWQIEFPEVPAIGLPFMEIIPIQLISLYLAMQIGVEPGHFTRTGKITLSE